LLVASLKKIKERKKENQLLNYATRASLSLQKTWHNFTKQQQQNKNKNKNTKTFIYVFVMFS